MNKVAGGGIPSAIWRRFMIEAHVGKEPRDFDWLLPDPVQETEEDPRNGFYGELAADFASAAASLEPEAGEVPALPAEPGQPQAPGQPYQPGQPAQPGPQPQPPRRQPAQPLPDGPIPY